MAVETSKQLATPCSATFTMDGQTGNLKVAVGAPVTLQADDAAAATYHWAVTSEAAGNFELTGDTSAQATLTLRTAGAFRVQLTTTRDGCTSSQRQLLWGATPHGYRLPASGEPLGFDGDAEWAGDLEQVVLDVDARLPTAEQAAALGAADAPGAANAFVTYNQWTATALTPQEKTTILGALPNVLSATEKAALQLARWRTRRHARRKAANALTATNRRTRSTADEKAALWRG
ncbi:MAG: hypothetical protein U0641_00750 [Anaerolineae bacterium]